MSSADVAELIEEYQGMFDYNAIGYACLALLVYDWLTSLGQESVVIWSKPKTAASALYIFSRYTVLLSNVIALLAGFPGILITEVCHDYYSITCGAQLFLSSHRVFSALRVYALTQKNKPLSAVVLVLGLGPFVVNMAAIYQINFYFDDAGCQAFFVSTYTINIILTVDQLCRLVVFARAPLILSDLIVVIVTWFVSYKVVRLAKNTIKGPTLHQVMLGNGTLYFLCLMVLNILQIMFYVLSIFAFLTESYISEALDPLSSILICHFILNLRQVDNQSSHTSTPSFVMPDLGHIDSLRSSFAGPVQTTHSDNVSETSDV
ncbi:hypothetical protein ONZ51_g7536 [Trametes cubensis]|uniref:DUF6533 domain-containing protein n=1 Tax=Trametes cubensis TaxID=1111947 RepID=A0AAD7TPY0_9APHY|nr:hypothetical protein ONZ51_g7536 [Trametes cubensis]